LWALAITVSGGVASGILWATIGERLTSFFKRLLGWTAIAFPTYLGMFVQGVGLGWITDDAWGVVVTLAASLGAGIGAAIIYLLYGDWINSRNGS